MMNNDITLEGLSLHVSDVERSIEFYSRIPGAQLVGHRPGQFARFQIGTGVCIWSSCLDLVFISN